MVLKLFFFFNFLGYCNERYIGLKFLGLLYSDLNKNNNWVVVLNYMCKNYCYELFFLGFKVSKYFNSYFINFLKYMY